MNALDLICAAVAIVAIGFAGFTYRELWRWAKQCQNARIAIAYNNRVQLSAPLDEWLGWANQLGSDDASRGRMIYKANKVSVSILRPRPVGKTRGAILRARRRALARFGRAPAPALKTGAARSMKFGGE